MERGARERNQEGMRGFAKLRYMDILFPFLSLSFSYFTLYSNCHYIRIRQRVTYLPLLVVVDSSIHIFPLFDLVHFTLFSPLSFASLNHPTVISLFSSIFFVVSFLKRVFLRNSFDSSFNFVLLALFRLPHLFIPPNGSPEQDSIDHYPNPLYPLCVTPTPSLFLLFSLFSQSRLLPSDTRSQRMLR